MSDIEKNRIAEIRALLHELKELFEPPKLTTDMADVWHKVLRLGHASPATTANMYADVSFEDMQNGVTGLYVG